MGQTMSMTFDTKKVSMSAMGKNMDIQTQGAYICDGPAIDYIIGGLPLSEGYSIVFEIPDMTTGKAKQVTLLVKGTEEVNGKKCWKVFITAVENEADSLTLWINQQTKYAEKMVQIIPAMANAKMTITRK
jgi:hypothetical protein